MLLFENLRQAYNSLVLNKKRTVLTMIGIIIGLSAVLAIVSIGDTISSVAENYMIQSFFGGNKVYLLSGKDVNAEHDDDFDLDESYKFTRDEVYDFIDSTDGVILDLDKNLEMNSTASVKIDKEHEADFTIKGVSSAYEVTNKLRIKCGRFLRRDESRYRKPVAVISDIAAEKLFGSGSNAIGKTIDVDGVASVTEGYDPETYEPKVSEHKFSETLTVVGVYEFIVPEKEKELGNINRTTELYTPRDYLMSVFGQETDDFQIMQFVVKDAKSTLKAEELIKDFALEKFGDDPDYEYTVLNYLDDLKVLKDIISIITAAFVVIAAISLVVGGIGLMNTMLVSVTERTKEIGIKKALGARNSSIRAQFLFESALICLIACSVGIFFGIMFGMLVESNLSKLVNLVPNDSMRYFLLNTEIHVTPSVNAILVSTLFSLAVGIIFGYYPANKGAKMQPVEALRYE